LIDVSPLIANRRAKISSALSRAIWIRSLVDCGNILSRTLDWRTTLTCFVRLYYSTLILYSYTCS
jgi:hypothetical protein